ncbi:hypothetical protein Pcinc_000014 [Petrolisthes cinctipes]|uniref:Uncharacterized protein n=1 Tax=Petrolisthes cinctipes TaxID=88211 RepID=A0AAE1GQ97_PETCI|nr:hypothetical protein Pcinc_000014 [Petrolisthes cinctipes]
MYIPTTSTPTHDTYAFWECEFLRIKAELGRRWHHNKDPRTLNNPYLPRRLAHLPPTSRHQLVLNLPRRLSTPPRSPSTTLTSPDSTHPLPHLPCHYPSSTIYPPSPISTHITILHTHDATPQSHIKLVPPPPPPPSRKLGLA